MDIAKLFERTTINTMVLENRFVRSATYLLQMRPSAMRVTCAAAPVSH
jgi:2,4-dienoyl-CoA reductase-like NADH-dependent reductase (Old Yellow Enzyme family)